MTNAQIPMTNNAPMTNAQLVLGHWSLIGHWCLVIGASALAARVGFEEALQVRLLDLRLARRDVVELAFLHPLFEALDLAEEVLEGVDDEQQGLVVIDLEVLVDHPLELEREALHLRRGHAVLDLAVAAEQARAVDLEFVRAGLVAHEAELDGEPEEARHRLDDALDVEQALVLVGHSFDMVGGLARDLAEAHEHV